ncbi:hypothetical protein EHM69_02470 [candidate division KSB1 bacterium]|nr:MAG: hypothetical protein EHM69_02470 [candidate division KSB1 bacterium]
MEIGSTEEIRVVNEILKMLNELEPEARRRVLATVETFIKFDNLQVNSAPPQSTIAELHGRQTSLRSDGDFSTDRTISAKQFLFDKKPQSDVERIACLAYYLTHYQDLLEFQTRDVSLLNTEAAQQKFSNPSVAISNAARAGYIIPSSKSYWRISAIGEVYVRALPDRDAAKEALTDAPARRQRKSSAKRAKKMVKQ